MQSLGLALHDAARLLKSEFERRARGQKLTLMQWRVLAVLWKSDGLTQTALAARIDASPMTISDILDRLDTLGLVRRETDPGDSRAKLAFITEAARPIVDEMKRIATEVYDKALAGIDGGDRETLMKALCRIAANLDAGSTAQKEEELS